jgi:hypothetical protein
MPCRCRICEPCARAWDAKQEGRHESASATDLVALSLCPNSCCKYHTSAVSPISGAHYRGVMSFERAMTDRFVFLPRLADRAFSAWRNRGRHTKAQLQAVATLRSYGVRVPLRSAAVRAAPTKKRKREADVTAAATAAIVRLANAPNAAKAAAEAKELDHDADEEAEDPDAGVAKKTKWAPAAAVTEDPTERARRLELRETVHELDSDNVDMDSAAAAEADEDV